MAKKQKKIVIGNWKMNPNSLAEARKVFSGIKKYASKYKNIIPIICPPFVYINGVRTNSPTPVRLGAQDVFWELSGAFTGNVSSLMLKNSGVTHVIVGHSEKRAQGDTDEIVNKKIHAVLKDNMTVILCVGESQRDTEGHYLEFLRNQVKNSLARVQRKFFDNIIIAYEPIWAIGKGDEDAMTGTQMHETSIFIKKILADILGKTDMTKTAILYGGSVSPRNAGDIVSSGHIDGLLVGRQSLDARSFGEILQIINKI